MGIDAFVGQILVIPFNFAPKGFAMCHGQLMPIASNTALFSLLGPTYGGDGKTTFALPDLRGRVPLKFGQGAGLTAYAPGETGGTETTTLSAAQLPQHTHTVDVSPMTASARCSGAAGNQGSPAGTVPAASAGTSVTYSNAGADTAMSAAAVVMGGSLTAADAGQNQPHDNRQPYLALNYCIALQGIYPSAGSPAMSDEPFITEVVLFSFNFAPRGWAQCNGQLLPINQNQAMFALIGTTYGGDGRTTFALPDLRGRSALGAGTGPMLSTYDLGQKGGAEAVTLTAGQMAQHTHLLTPGSMTAALRCRGGSGNQQAAVGNVAAADASNTVATYSNAPPDAAMNPAAIALAGTPAALVTGGSQPHENRQPYLPLTFCIALQGIFPSQS